MVPPAVTTKRERLLYAGAVALVFAGLALFRADLTAGAFRATMASLAAGPASAAKIIFEIALFAAIMVLTLRTVSEAADPVMDGLVVLAASVYGWLAEYAGTVSGLWTYYTGETPPLWIVPAWPLGALLIGRLSRRTEEVLGKLTGDRFRAALFPAWTFLFYLVYVPFLAGQLPVLRWLPAAALAAAAFIPGRERRARDAAVLITGTVCVFFADLWGTTNNCWAYYTQPGVFGTAYGILFGALFDSVLVLASLKTAEALRSVKFTG